MCTDGHGGENEKTSRQKPVITWFQAFWKEIRNITAILSCSSILQSLTYRNFMYAKVYCVWTCTSVTFRLLLYARMKRKLRSQLQLKLHKLYLILTYTVVENSPLTTPRGWLRGNYVLNAPTYRHYLLEFSSSADNVCVVHSS